MGEVDRLLMLRVLGQPPVGRDQDQGRALAHGRAGRGLDPADDAALLGQNRELHLHGFQDRDDLARDHRVALGHADRRQPRVDLGPDRGEPRGRGRKGVRLDVLA